MFKTGDAEKLRKVIEKFDSSVLSNDEFDFMIRMSTSISSWEILETAGKSCMYIWGWREGRKSKPEDSEPTWVEANQIITEREESKNSEKNT